MKLVLVIGAEEISDWFETQIFVRADSLIGFILLQVMYHVPDDRIGQHHQHFQSSIQYWFALEIRHASNHIGEGG